MAAPRINGKTSPFVARPYFCCNTCEEVVPRRSNSQKYCDACRHLANSHKVAAYYKKHRTKILKAKAIYRAENHESILEKMRIYHQETKLERPTRPEIRAAKLALAR